MIDYHPSHLAADPAFTSRYAPINKIVGFAEGTNSAYTTASASETDITASVGASPTLTLALDPTHRYKAVFTTRWQSTIDGDIVQARFVENGTNRKSSPLRCSTATNLAHHHEWLFIPTSNASVIYKVTGARVTGSGTVSCIASTTSPMQFWIEDMGPF